MIPGLRPCSLYRLLPKTATTGHSFATGSETRSKWAHEAADRLGTGIKPPRAGARPPEQDQRRVTYLRNTPSCPGNDNVNEYPYLPVRR
ncbi:hypothetical protein Sinac_0086 [Singulisphaera acidiphila DSM 18658]|uniref:Uncharacterized protein n=1 Tax=Singulisphaera acidiphila (strain ATCC BAA-1392 / DSM 18658 / VKM B-2454 / MOB10) TaxID=886293 RepID=L0D5L1_SINAD|nr:hypothetical protein Sinac_0086 [Singulisphaera acidiphila DSM 18658]